MKRIGYLYEKAFTLESLYDAYLCARKGKRNKKCCYEFELNLGSNIYKLYDELKEYKYKPMKYNKFKVYEPKERVIYAPHFRDVIVQHAIYKIIYPIYNKTFIDQSFACRKGMGTHKCSQQTQKYLRNTDSELYTLKLDIRKYFYSIDRKILKKLLEKKIKDKKFIELMCLFSEMDTDKGIPIGNLLSQLYSLIYLNYLDHYIKRELKIKKYIRYVDDFILIGITRDQCLEYRQYIIDFILEELNLYLSKSTIQKVKKGLNFVGYRTWKNKKFIRKYSLFKFKKLLNKRKIKSIISILGHSKYTNSLLYLLSMIKWSNNNDLQISKDYRRIYNIHIK